MATAAQIDANRRNAARSTGPRTNQGKSRARLNSLKHGLNAKTVTPVLPHEDPRQLEERIQHWVQDLKPRNAVERGLVCRAARLSWGLERAERFETAHLASRVRRVQEKESLRRLKKVHSLARKLLDHCDPRKKTATAPHFDDEPAVFLAELEQTPEGCRLLLERWGQFRTMLDTNAPWTEPDHYRFIRLQGKHTIEAMNDPSLNIIFLALETLSKGYGKKLWIQFRDLKALSGPVLGALLQWREIAPRPLDQAEAMGVLASIVVRNIRRLQAHLAEHEQRALDEAPELADSAAFDAGSSFERLRRYQSARGRELLRTLDILMKMQKAEFGMERADCEEEQTEWPQVEASADAVPPPAELVVSVETEPAARQDDDSPAAPAVPAGFESPEGKSNGAPAPKSKPQAVAARQRRANEANAMNLQAEERQEDKALVAAFPDTERTRLSRTSGFPEKDWIGASPPPSVDCDCPCNPA